MAARADLSPGDWAVLAVIAEQPNHGYGIAQLLAPTGDFGRVWSMSRQRVYHAIEKLQQHGLVETTGTEQRRARQRRVITITPAGTALIAAWLVEPVEHVRDIRSDLMLKLLIHYRAGTTTTRLLRAQMRLISAQIEGTRRNLQAARGFERTLLQWRLHTAEATERFLDEQLTTAR